MEYCLYCDETCHIESDGVNVMALGTVWCPKREKDRIFDELRAIKVKHGFAPYWELKWNAVSAKKLDFYMEIVEYFLMSLIYIFVLLWCRISLCWIMMLFIRHMIVFIISCILIY